MILISIVVAIIGRTRIVFPEWRYSMKKILILTSILAICGLLPLAWDGPVPDTRTPAYAVCSAAEIKNDCCFKFIEKLYADTPPGPGETRETRAVTEFRRCLRKDIGCSQEMTEMKAKAFEEIRALCGKHVGR